MFENLLPRNTLSIYCVTNINCCGENMKKPICYVDGRKVDNKDVEVLLTQECVDFLFMPCWKSMIKIPEEIVETVFRTCTEIEAKGDFQVQDHT